MTEAPPAATRIWEASTPVQIVFGSGALDELRRLVTGRAPLLLTTAGATSRGLTGRIVQLLKALDITVADRVRPNVELDDLETLATELASWRGDCIIAAGGGSAIDAAKVLGRLLRSPGSDLLRHHLERGDPLPTTLGPLPVIAIPTTAGTGAEVTPFATVWDRRRGVKHSFTLGDPYPDAALLDPALTLNLPHELTLSTGLDALCQALESLWSVRSNPVSQAFAQPALRTALSCLPKTLSEPADLSLRTGMMEASLLSGLAISITRTTLSHSISYPLTMKLGIPHGLACAFTISQVLCFNAEQHPNRLDQIARSVGSDSAGDLAQRIQIILRETGAYRKLMKSTGQRDAVLRLASEGVSPGRADNNPRPAAVSDIESILDSALTTAREFA